MSYVSDVFIIARDYKSAEHKRLAEFTTKWMMEDRGREYDGSWAYPIIGDPFGEHGALQGGTKVGGGAVMWLGWNYFRPQEFAAALEAAGFRWITIWYETEGEDPEIIKVAWHD